MPDHYDHIYKIQPCARKEINSLCDKLKPLLKDAKEKFDIMLSKIDELEINSPIFDSNDMIKILKEIIETMTKSLVDVK